MSETVRFPRPGDPRGGRPRHSGPGAASVVGALVVAFLAALVTFPDVLGIDNRTPFVQLVAFRPQIAVGVLVIGALVVAARGRTWPAGVALVLVGVVAIVVVLPRAFADGAGAGKGRELSVLSVNTYLGKADEDALAGLIGARTPDVVVLPEAGGTLRRGLVGALDDDQGGSGYRSYVADASTDESPMTVLVRRSLGRPTVTVDREAEYPSLVVDIPDVGSDGVRVVATHPQSPKPGDTFAWQRDVAGLGRWCTTGEPTVVAGDLNSTLDHAELRDAIEGCTDSASAVGAGLTGTWPSWLPPVLGAQIDHVLVSGGPSATAVDVIDIEGSDHRGVLATVAVP